MRYHRKYSDAALAKMFKGYSDGTLKISYDACGYTRVKTGKNKGHITMRALRWSDVIFAEQRRRRDCAMG